MRRLGVSNLAWSPDAETAALALLAEHGVSGVEVAPTRIAPWEELTPARLAAFCDGCREAGLSVSSLQAVFFGRPEATLLADAAGFDAMCAHMRVLAGVAEALGAGVAVFGAPKSRLRGDLSNQVAMALAAERLRVLGDIAATGGLTLGMEPVPPVYGADFLNRYRDILDIVALTDHPNVRAHLDTGCVTLGGDLPGDAIRAAAPVLAHYHMAEAQLGPFDAPAFDHEAAGKALDEIGYDRWVVIEMKQGEGDGLAAVATAIGYAKRHYVRTAA
ncbi:sugar phosphate isomerase/epimerase family protein [Lichenicola sp.]|uniref:sugar phosphate isomerase/epimerase family protein n=1 Tax=Lichenicola sp. TaxID=2804529 RepID=UPI003AFFDEA9